jgi:hypothetical protein
MTFGRLRHIVYAFAVVVVAAGAGAGVSFCRFLAQSKKAGLHANVNRVCKSHLHTRIPVSIHSQSWGCSCGGNNLCSFVHAMRGTSRRAPTMVFYEFLMKWYAYE